jgi:hypothetical protein
VTPGGENRPGGQPFSPDGESLSPFPPIAHLSLLSFAHFSLNSSFIFAPQNSAKETAV